MRHTDREYEGLAAPGYFDYWDNIPHYYSYNIGSWHLIALNSNCAFVACSVGSAQESWLAGDLAANTKPCTLAYFHHPRYTSGQELDTPSLQPLWADLYAARADLVLVGHDHEYERFAPMDANGIASDPGVREFVVGTGGESHYSFSDTDRSESRSPQNGALRMAAPP